MRRRTVGLSEIGFEPQAARVHTQLPCAPGRLIDQLTDAGSVGVGVVVHLALFVQMRMRMHGPVSVGVRVLVLDPALFVGVARVFLVAGSGV